MMYPRPTSQQVLQSRALNHARGLALHYRPLSRCLRVPRSYEWVDDDTIAALVVPADRGAPPPQPPAPIGPSILDNTAGRTSQVHTGGIIAMQHLKRVCALLCASVQLAVVQCRAYGFEERRRQCLRTRSA